jgi:hypothetical protein
MRLRATTWVLEFLVDDRRLRFVDSSSPRAARARFVVQDVFAFPDPRGEALLRDGGFREVGTFTRPRGGGAVRLFERT